MDVKEIYEFYDSINIENKEYRLHNNFLVKSNNLLLDTLKCLSNHLLAIDEDLKNMSNVELVINILKIKGVIEETIADHEDLKQDFFGDYLVMEHEQDN